MSAVEEAVAASRRLHPELWDKVDHIAEIIDPSAFPKMVDTRTGKKLDNHRMRYSRAVARRRAWEVLRYLGVAPEKTDWTEIFREMDRTPDSEQEEG